MKHAKALMLLSVLIVFSGLIIYFGCGDYNVPEGASEVEKTGFIISTDDQQTYLGDTYFDVSPATILPSGTVTYYYEPWDPGEKNIDAEFKFVFIANPTFECSLVPSYVIVDECQLSIPSLNYKGEKHTCGPWRVDLSAGGESELTVTTNVWSLGWLASHISSGGNNGDLLSGSAWFKIWAKSIDGTEQEAETYAILNLEPQTDDCKDYPTPSWMQFILPQCNNGFDDDADGDIDYPADAECTDSQDDDESVL